MRVVVLASGGVDSSVMMYLLKRRKHELLPLFIDYGQLARNREWEACQRICQYLGLDPSRLDISGFGRLIPSGITNRGLDIEKDAFLPARNLLFLTLGSSYGYVKSAYVVAIGLLSNPIFPDQTTTFIQKAQDSIAEALEADIKVLAPLISLNKVDTLRLARKYKLPLDLMYYCHSGEKEPCGKCISCKEHNNAEKNSHNNM